MAGKPGRAIITCAVPADNGMLPPACDYGVNAVKFYMAVKAAIKLGKGIANRLKSQYKVHWYIWYERKEKKIFR